MRKPDLVTTAMVVTAGGTIAAKVADKNSGDTGLEALLLPAVGVFVLGAFLYAIGEASPDVANAFAGLVLVTGILVNGEKLAAAFKGGTTIRKSNG